MIPQALCDRFSQIRKSNQFVTVLTGAGISAESGIPTFRGPEGYWTVGSHVYQPQEMATQQMFRQQPDAVWAWYLYRRSICRQAKPNSGHLALASLEAALEDRFCLITQNVDGLHIKAGNSPERTFQIHGNIFFMRCIAACTAVCYPIPETLPDKAKGAQMTAKDQKELVCPDCGAPTRPHVLWFDEAYDETHFKFHSSMAAAQKTDVLLVVGTSGATSLPNHVAETVRANDGSIIDINIESNIFTQMARTTSGGGFIQAPSATVLPAIANLIQKVE